MANRVVHFDVYADDVDRAIAFYQKVFGWTIEKVAWMDYWLIKTGKGEPGIDGGLSRRENPRRELSRSLASPVRWTWRMRRPPLRLPWPLGAARYTSPARSLGVGYFGYVRDTEGNHLGLMQRDPEAK